jgi:hypothetical protein
MRYQFLLKCSTEQCVRDDRIYEDGPPSESDVIEATILRERMRVRVLSIHRPDRTGTIPAEITVERIR